MASMTRSLTAVLLAAGVVAAADSAGAARADGPALRETAAGATAERASLLTRTDLGAGWTATTTGASGLLVSCNAHRPSGAGIVETGDASSPTFAAGKAGPFIVQVTSVYGSDAQASAYWRRAVTRASWGAPASRCRRSPRAGSGSGCSRRAPCRSPGSRR